MSLKNELQKSINNLGRRLQKLKEQKTKFGLHTPPHILIEIEDTEKEIEKLETQLENVNDGQGETEDIEIGGKKGEDELEEIKKRVEALEEKLQNIDDSWDDSTSQSIKLEKARDLFLLARILYEYKLQFKNEMNHDRQAEENFKKARTGVVNKIKTTVPGFTEHDWDSLDKSDVAAAGELFSEEDWKKIDELAGKQDIEKTLNILRLCGKVGGIIAVDILIEALQDDKHKEKVEVAVQALQILVDRTYGSDPEYTASTSSQDISRGYVAVKMLEIIKSIQASTIQKVRAVKVLAFSGHTQHIKDLLALITSGIEEEKLRLQIREAIVNIAYNPYANTLSPTLCGSLIIPPEPKINDFASRALVEAGDKIVGGLVKFWQRPGSYNAKLTKPILHILSQIGENLTRTNGAESRFQATLTNLFHSDIPDEVNFALQVLAGIQNIDWAVQYLNNSYAASTLIEDRNLIRALKHLPMLATTEEDFLPFTCAALKNLSDTKGFLLGPVAQLTVIKLGCDE